MPLMNILIAGNVLLTVVLVAALYVTWRVMARVRQLFREVAPVGALTNSRGPQPGEATPSQPFHLLNGGTISLATGKGPRLLLFVSATCPVSRKVIPIAQDFARREQVDLLFAGDDTQAVQERFIAASGMPADHFVNDPALGRALEVDKLPAAFLLAPDGVLLARGLVNSREHLESLLNAWESGFATVQDYISHTRRQKTALA